MRPVVRGSCTWSRVPSSTGLGCVGSQLLVILSASAPLFFPEGLPGCLFLPDSTVLGRACPRPRLPAFLYGRWSLCPSSCRISALRVPAACDFGCLPSVAASWVAVARRASSCSCILASLCFRGIVFFFVFSVSAANARGLFFLAGSTFAVSTLCLRLPIG